MRVGTRVSRSWASFAVACAVTGIASPLGAQQTSRGGFDTAATRFTVRIENTSKPSTLKLSRGGSASIPVSPGTWAVHTGGNPMLIPGQIEAGIGLKGLAEAGLATEFASNLKGLTGVQSHGVFDKPMAPLVRIGGMTPRKAMTTPSGDGNTGSGALASRMLQPGHRFEFIIEARPGDRLSLAMMIAQSNDGIIGTGADGIALFDVSGHPVNGNVTDQLYIWDAGTEVNEEPGLGRTQGLRQGAPHAGDPERRPVRSMSEAEFGGLWPTVDRIVRVTLRPAAR